MVLNSVEQAFIQNAMAIKAMTASEAIKLYNHCLDKAGRGSRAREIRDSEGLDHRMSKINKELESMELQFKTMYSPWEKEVYWGLCNTIEDEAAHCATVLNKQEIALFFAIVDELREFDGEIKLVDAQNVTAERTAHVAENGRTIQKLHTAQWLKIVRRQNAGASVILGPRALLELPNVRHWTRQFAQAESRAVEDEGREPDVDLEEESDEDVRRGRKRRVTYHGGSDEEEDEEDDLPRRASQSQARRRASRRSGR